jgi:hypothetical protein
VCGRATYAVVAPYDVVRFKDSMFIVIPLSLKCELSVFTVDYSANTFVA